MVQENQLRNTGFLRCLNVGSKVWAGKREKGGFQGGFWAEKREGQGSELIDTVKLIQ